MSGTPESESDHESASGEEPTDAEFDHELSVSSESLTVESGVVDPDVSDSFDGDRGLANRESPAEVAAIVVPLLQILLW